MRNLTSLLLILIFSGSVFAQDTKKNCKKPGAKSPLNAENVTITAGLKTLIIEMMQNGKKLDAIRELRKECKDMNLQENKEFVESL